MGVQIYSCFQPLPTVASRSANYCSSSGVPEIASGRTRTRAWRSGRPEFAQRQTPTHILIKCQAGLSFFYGRLANILGHLGHECQHQARRQDLAAGGPHLKNAVLDVCSNRTKRKMGRHRFQMGDGAPLAPPLATAWPTLEIFLEQLSWVDTVCKFKHLEATTLI